MDQQRLDRIRLLSARFHELQGLRLAFAGACLTLGVGGYIIGAPQPTDPGAMIAMVASFVPVVAGMPWLNRYYAATFGRQVWSRPRVRAALPDRLLRDFLLPEHLDPVDPGGCANHGDRCTGLGVGCHT